jgi:hypothetical protein
VDGREWEWKANPPEVEAASPVRGSEYTTNPQQYRKGQKNWCLTLLYWSFAQFLPAHMVHEDALVHTTSRNYVPI